MLGFGGCFVFVIITCQLVYLGFVCIIKLFLVDEIYSSATNVTHYECISFIFLHFHQSYCTTFTHTSFCQENGKQLKPFINAFADMLISVHPVPSFTKEQIPSCRWVKGLLRPCPVLLEQMPLSWNLHHACETMLGNTY